MIELVALALYAGLLIYAAGSDIASLTIPNWLSIALAALFPAAALAYGMELRGIGLHVLFALGVLAAGFVLFQFNILGGGDAKLIAATSAWAGLQGFIPFLFWTAIAGGMLALALVGARHFLKQTETNPPFVNQLLKQQNGIPYGVAIMIGGLAAAPSIPILSSALTMP
jgi:prepilin peptidase CpaA